MKRTLWCKITAMEIKISFQEARTLYPRQVEALHHEIRKERSKSKDDPLATFTWSIWWGVQSPATPGTLLDILQRKREGLLAKVEQSIEERVEDYASRCICSLQAAKGRGRWQVKLPDTPEAVKDQHRKSLIKEQKEQARVATLTPEERARETEELLSQLRGSPGFIELHVGAPEEDQ